MKLKSFLTMVLKYVVILFIFTTLFSYAMFQGGFVSWFLFYSFLPILLYMFLILIYPISNIKVKRSLEQKILQAGDSITVHVELTRKFPFPLYYSIFEEYIPQSLCWRDIRKDKYRYLGQSDQLKDMKVVKQVSFPWFKRQIKYAYTIADLPRGEHELSVVRIKTGDFFGFIKKEALLQKSDSFTVLPNKRAIQFKQRANSYDEGASPSHALNVKDTNVVTSIREYMPGDRFSWIDWKASARKNTMMTKEFEQQKSFDMILILDAAKSNDNNRLAFEAAVELSASLIDAFRLKSGQLAFLSLGKDRVFFPFHQDQYQKEKLKHHLATIAQHEGLPFAKRLNKEIGNLPQGLISMLVTTNISPGLFETVAGMKQRSQRVILFLIQSTLQQTEEQESIIKKLKYSGVIINVLTEEDLVQQTFEVNT